MSHRWENRRKERLEWYLGKVGPKALSILFSISSAPIPNTWAPSVGPGTPVLL